MSLVPVVGIPFTSTKIVSETYVAYDVLEPIKLLSAKVIEQKGQFKLNSIFRSWTKQQELRTRYENYEKLSAEEKKKVPFVPLAAFPGGSFHMAGRAIDVSIKDLNFKDTYQADQLKKFWDIAIPLGFRPIIDKPDSTLSEAWHFDYCGPWDNVRTKFGYSLAAKCAILDIGNWNPKESESKVKSMFVQAQLLRLDYNIGEVDGVLGTKSKQALAKEKLEKSNLDEIILKLSKK